MQEFGVLFTFMLFAFLFGIFMLICSVIFAPKSNNEHKESTYECGLNIQSDSRIKFNLQFFVYAIVFLIFDIETIFIFPFALSFNFLGIFAFVEVTIFISLLLLGLIYSIRRRMLRFK